MHSKLPDVLRGYFWRVGNLWGSRTDYLSQGMRGCVACGRSAGTETALGVEGGRAAHPVVQAQRRGPVLVPHHLSPPGCRSWSGSPSRSRGTRLRQAR